MDACRLRRITGSAVVTTKLSRLTMNKATEVMATVQRTACRRSCVITSSNRNSELEVGCSRLGHSTGFTLTMEMPRSRKTVTEAVQLGLVDDATRERALVSVGVELELLKALANAGPKGARAEVANRGSRGQRRRWRAGETQGPAEDECDRRRDQRHREEASGEGGETQDSAQRGDRGETGVTVEDANRRDDREYVDGDEQGRGRANQGGRSADSGQQSEQDSPGDHGDRDKGAPRHTSGAP